MKNVLVTGAGTVLGRALLRRLRLHEGVEHLVGAEATSSSDWLDGAEMLPLPDDHGGLVSLLTEYPIDTVIHCGLAPDRSGSQMEPREARVIDTMQLGAAIASAETSVRAWVLASSSSVYPVETHSPLLHRESSAIEAVEGTLAASIHEAEEYARDVAARRPHLDVSILRLQHLVGYGVRSPLAALLREPVLPSVIGYDGAFQMLALQDAVAALSFAAELELAGVYNVSSSGTIRLSEAIRVLEKPSLPVLPFEAGMFGGIARRLGVPHVPNGVLDILRFGHAVDTSKLATAGFTPECDQPACLEGFRARASDDEED